MKKLFLTVLMLSAIVFAGFAQSGVIREVSGEVELKPSGASAFTAAGVGDTVARDTIVSTGFKGTAVITIGSSTITVRPLTRLSLAEIQSASGSETLNVNLQAGRVRVDVNPPTGTRTNMSVQGPTATASVRGTSFEFDTVNLTVHEGTVSFSSTSSGAATMVRRGESSLVGTDGQPVSPVDVTTASLLPSAPVGSETPVGTQGSPSSSSGDIDVTLKFPE